MTQQPVIMRPGAVPHHGLVSPDCPIECLLTVLAFNPLARALCAPFDPPGTVGEVIELHAHRELRQISGLGRRRTSEIEAGLVFAGLVVTSDLPRPGASAKRELGKAAE